MGTGAPLDPSSPPTTSTLPLAMPSAEGYHRPFWSLSASTSSSQSLVPWTPGLPSGTYSLTPKVASPAQPPTVSWRPALSGRVSPAEQKRSVLTCMVRQARSRPSSTRDRSSS